MFVCYTLKDPPDASLSNIPVISVWTLLFKVVLPQHSGVEGLDGSSGGAVGLFWMMKLVWLSPLI